MRPRTYASSTVLALSLLATVIALQTYPSGSNPPEMRYQTANPSVMTSEDFIVDYQIAQELNRMPGVNGAAVLINGETAYVGAHVIGNEPQIIGDRGQSSDNVLEFRGSNAEQPIDLRGRDARSPERSLYSGKGTAEQLARNTLRTQRRANPHVTANTVSEIGNLDPSLRKQLESKVRVMSPSVNNVYITANYENTAALQAYARNVHEGGSIQGLTKDLKDTVKRIWPDAKVN